jgi:glycosyltransferase involved in cell wall biosynthesis
MHILLISDNFYPETNAPASRGLEHCKFWVKRGHQVSVLTSFPNFPGGKIFTGYKNKLRQIDNVEGINVVRVWTYMSPNTGVWRRILDQMSFMVSSFINGLFLKDVDVVIGTTPHIFTPISAVLLSKIKKSYFVLELRDLWPDSMLAVGISNKKYLFKLAKLIEKKIYFGADKIIPVTYSFKKYLINFGISNNKIKVIMNGVDTNFFNFKNSKYLKRSSNTFMISYIGTLGMAHSIETIIEAARILSTKYKKLTVKFQIIGDGADRENIVKQALKTDNVEVLSTVPKEQVLEYLDRSDAGIIHLKKNDLFKTVIPSKMFEYMAMGVPILHGVEGESYDIVRKHNLGLYFEGENPNDLCSVILKLYNNKLLYDEISKNCVKTSKLFKREVFALKMLEEITKIEKSR